MSDSKPALPQFEDSHMTNGTSVEGSAQLSKDIVSNHDQTDNKPYNFDFAAMSGTQEHGVLREYPVFGSAPTYDYHGNNYNMTGDNNYNMTDHGMTGDYNHGMTGNNDHHMTGETNHDMIGDNMVQNNHFSGDFQETMDSKTPGYPSYDTETGGYFSSDVHDSSSAQVGHEFQPSHGAQTPFAPHTHTYEAKTPFVAAVPDSSPRLAGNTEDMAELSLDVGASGAQPSADLFFGPQSAADPLSVAQPSANYPGLQSSEDFSTAQPVDDTSALQPPDDMSAVQPSDDVSRPQESLNFYPGPSPMDETFPFSEPSSPVIQPVSTKKTPTPRKAKTMAMTAIAGKEDSEDETRSLLASRGKGKGKAAAPVDVEQDDQDDDLETPATGSSSKGKGRKGAAASKTSTNTPTKRSRAAAAKKATKAAAAGLNTMGHQRVRQVRPFFHLTHGLMLTCTKGSQEWHCPDQAHPSLV
jgi:hypothetical protein